MPTTTRSRTTQTSSSVLERDPELEALGLGIAPGLPGDDRSERERAEIGAGQPRRGASAADPPGVSRELVDQAVGRAAGRRRLRQALGVPSDRAISDEVIDELLAGASTEEEIAGPGGLLAQLTKREREIFELMIRGYTNPEIASRLVISLRTVETHRHRIVKKVCARSIVEMQRLAARYGRF